jgi:hypothetical protein
VHVCTQSDKTLAPWNVDYLTRNGDLQPVFYHFQGFRILSPTRIKLYHGYRISRRNRRFYDAYIGELRDVAQQLASRGAKPLSMPEHGIMLPGLRRVVMTILGKTRIVKLRPALGEVA